MRQGVDRSLMAGAVGIGGLALAVVCLGAGPQVGRASTRPASDPPESQGKVSVAPAPASPGFEQYRPLLEHNPFAPRLPKRAQSEAEKKAPVLPAADGKDKPTPAADEKKPAAPAASAPDPLKDWTYTGTVVMGADAYAVVENKAAKEFQYVKRGDPLAGGTVAAIAQGELTVLLQGQSRSLPKSTAFNATPLTPSAPAGGGGKPRGPEGPAGPGGPGGSGRPGPNGPGGPNGPNLPPGVVMPAGAMPQPVMAVPAGVIIAPGDAVLVAPQ